MIVNLGSVSGKVIELGYLGPYTGAAPLDYILLAATHGVAHPNSIMAQATFASTGDVEIGVVSDFDPNHIVFDWQAISDGQLWLQNINDLAAVTITAASDVTAVATLEYRVVDTGETGTFDLTVLIADLDFSGVIYTDSAFSGALSVAVPVAGTLVQATAIEGTMTAGLPLTGTIDQTPAIVGTLEIYGELQGTIEQGTALEGTLGIATPLEALLEQQTTLTGTLSIAVPLAGTLQQSSEFEGSLTRGLPLSGFLLQHNRLSGNLASSLLLSSDPLYISQRGLLTATLISPNLNSAGWLTLSDITMHTDLTVDDIYFEPV